MRLPALLYGFAVHITLDRPKLVLDYTYTLPDGSKAEFLTKEQQRDTDAWLLARFGTVNMLRDGQSLVSEAQRAIWVNPRTHEELKRASRKHDLRSPFNSLL